MERINVGERALILSDRASAATSLQQAGFVADVRDTLDSVLEEMSRGAALVIVAELDLASTDLSPLIGWSGGLVRHADHSVHEE